ncbi:Glutathione S-transferase/chloride channel C-terminal [Penicillium robsamsonii]|uniref:Glutathione S-transferase/chloride channel C-terminal n=1 Tax=Penicillium robsamsonii TaxID=1792511 RepID=UPI002547BF0D|nr:Glutathione S-transferase/chloride channel C-terminal [Penicillium robsamsonii]KAJ5836269.1 Glutathione S-transferase/chloride channel C-terminal [Penicillium robsamsonii]
MSLKPITVWGHGPGPNPWKVIMILEELNVPYTHKIITFPDMKKEAYESINPNGRVPAIEDPNTDTTLWESGAIIEYLIDTYDKQNSISFAAGSKDYYLAKQWLHFQMSGQGPYFGQAVWFSRYHPEKLQSAIDRYVNEIRRVSGVLDRTLQGKQYLVGDKFSYADVAFLPWYLVTIQLEIDTAKDFPNVAAWLKRVQERPSIAKSVQDRVEASAQH